MRKVNAWLGIVLCAALFGCKSHPLGPYVSPRVEGQVVEAQSGAPLSGVSVRRGKPAFDSLAGYPKGGQLLMAKMPIETGRDGRFSLPGERVLSIIRGSGWNEVQLTFTKPGYDTLRTNLSATVATNAEHGEPVLRAGRISLQPAMR